MKFTAKVPTEIDAAYIRINVPIRYGTEDIPADFPFRRPWREGDTGCDFTTAKRHDRWDVTVAIDNGQIQGWPAGVEAEIDMKITDQGCYYLLNHAGEPVASIIEDYVPYCVPGDYGDYVGAKIGADGTIQEWGKKCTPERVRDSFYPAER